MTVGLGRSIIQRVSGGLDISTNKGDETKRPTGSPGEPATNQQRVYRYVKDHPGVHLRKICRDLELAIGDVQYHLDRLEKSGSVKSSRRGLYRHFYPTGVFGEREGLVLSALAERTPRELLLHIVESPGCSQEDLAAALGLSAPSISWNMKRLVRLGLVQREQKGRFATYTVIGNSMEIAKFVRSYHPGVWDSWSSRLTEIVLALSEEGTSLK
jgi:DNA-binding MarR family transcriptional regulator